MVVSRQEEFLTSGRQNQKQRTREAILDAATRLARAGKSPSMAEIAKDARVSTATAYRYYPNPESLWFDVTRHQHGGLEELLADLPADAEQRIDTVIRRRAESQLADEPLWRAVVRATLDFWFHQAELTEDERLPLRSGRRLTATRTALDPLEHALPPQLLHRLTMALMLVWGAEAMIVARDACGLSPEDTVEVMSWAGRALVRAALAEHDVSSIR
jgi:AcrR family transcriptional regulator